MLDRDYLAEVARKGPAPIFATVSGAHLYGFASAIQADMGEVKLPQPIEGYKFPHSICDAQLTTCKDPF